MSEIDPTLPDPDFEAPMPFIRYDPATGRIVAYGKQPRAFTQRERISPWPDEPLGVMLGEGEPETHYVTTDAAGVLAIRPRPETPVFDRTTMRAGEGALARDLPACKISFAGPVSGSEEHPGGDYEIGWTVSGTYEVSLDPFPAKRASLTFTIES